MESKNKKFDSNYNFKEYKHNNNKINTNIKEINNENIIKNKKEIIDQNKDNTYKRPNVINKLYKENLEIINDKEKQDIELEIIKEKINKMKQENEKLRSSVAKRDKLILDFKDRCNEQIRMVATMTDKIENIKKFIPEKSIKNKQNEKFEEQLAIQAVNEQIMKKICAGSEGQGVMNKIFEGKNKNDGIKNKIDNISQVYYKCNKFDNFECSICFDEFKENELLKQLRCKHIFHKECLSQWLLNEKKCPICNKIC